MNCIDYERYWDTLEMDRRFSYDIQKLIPELRNVRSIWDAKCGNGRHIKTLDSIYMFDNLYISDESANILMNTHLDMPLRTKSQLWDINSPLPSFVGSVEAILMIDIINELDKDSLRRTLRGLKGKIVLIRTSVAPRSYGNLWTKSALMSVLLDECLIVKDRYAYPKDFYLPTTVWFFCRV